jgi:internalin A
MRYYLLALCLVLFFAVPFYAQDELTPYENALQRIQEAAATGATELDLQRLRLTELPPEIGQLTNLESLNLYANRLTSVPPEIGQLTNLQELNLTWNQLTDLPPQIGQLTSLQRLSLAANLLTSVPPEIGQLTNLQSLNLDINRLTRLPSEIAKLTNLQYLYLNENQLRYLPPEMGNLVSLSCANCSIRLYNNPLISPPPEILEQGTEAMLAYLRNQAWYHIQRLIVGTVSGVGVLAALILGVRYRQNRRKPKAKRGLA